MDVVGDTRQLSVGWIKELHALLTRHQQKSDAGTSIGQRIEVPLVRGAWKLQPNNPLTWLEMARNAALAQWTKFL